MYTHTLVRTLRRRDTQTQVDTQQTATTKKNRPSCINLTLFSSVVHIVQAQTFRGRCGKRAQCARECHLRCRVENGNLYGPNTHAHVYRVRVRLLLAHTLMCVCVCVQSLARHRQMLRHRERTRPVINYSPNNNHSARMSIDTNVFYSSRTQTHACAFLAYLVPGYECRQNDAEPTHML